jgi:hypothetical protein
MARKENTMSAAAPARPRRKRAPEPAVEVVDIGPAEASELLASQRHNRKIRTAKIEEFAGAMVRGEWRLSNDALTVDRNGHLLNGQHRLRAVVQSGSTQPFIVMRGVMESAQETMDQGSRRSVADALTLRGEKNVARLGAMARHVFLYERDRSMYVRQPHATLAQLLDVLERHPGLRDAASAVEGATRNTGAAGGPLGACFYLFGLVDGANRDVFFQELSLGSGLIEDSPVYALRRFLIRPHGTNRPHAVAQAGATIRAWNAYREGRPLRSVAYEPFGVRAKPFPRIEGLDLGPEAGS